MTATMINMDEYLRRKAGVPEKPEDQVARVARAALNAFWAEVARAIPASRGVEAIKLAELEPLARLAVRSWIYINEDEEETSDAQ
jgi:hypothetical protein